VRLLRNMLSMHLEGPMETSTQIELPSSRMISLRPEVRK
jgi:hypothetical protein